MASRQTPDGWEFWIDRGGTFTDVVARRPDGTLLARKLLSENPERYDDAVIAGIDEVLEAAGETAGDYGAVDAVRMGTTVATNALLERTGERTLLLVTRGFRDALKIGYQQRPRLFDLNIQLPGPLAAGVVEVGERIDAGGQVLEPLDEAGLRADLATARRAGFEAVAIVFMHGYRYDAHERRAAQLAAAAGFSQISTSHRIGALARLVARGDTTVADAYLSPVLRRYVDRLVNRLGDTRLLFMQSNGGLTEARHFRGRDSILSGPAAGVVGMAATARKAGFDRLIGFDMGGTSTDVTLYDGEFERTVDNQVAGVRIQAPMMRIHTVAAGGGSLLSFRDGRFQVGPESGGADPGPTCYRRGGGLTVTDANLLLGRIQADYFPSVFGPGGDEALDKEAVTHAFRRLAGAVEAAGQDAMSAEQMAEGYLRIAVNRMAQAIKQISIQRGYDLERFTLCSFGGAAGQHACAVADALGIPRILLHPFAGVLSAYGMGLADLRCLRQETADLSLGPETQASLDGRFRRLEERASEHLEGQGAAAGSVRLQRRLHVRYDGSDTALAVPWGDIDGIRRAFDEAHQRQFGFREDRPRIVQTLSVEAVAPGGAGDARLPGAEDVADTRTEDEREVWLDGRWVSTPVFRRHELPAGREIEGPALIMEAHGTTVVAHGWCALVEGNGNLVLSRTGPGALARADSEYADPILLEVFNNLFMHIAEQMGVVLENTAHSVNIKERLDFSCALFDPDGGLVANAPHVPVHLGSMDAAIETVIREKRSEMRPGDVYVLNAPYNGGTHLPDVTVVTPVFDDTGEQILFYVASRGHHEDIGGLTPGSMTPRATNIEQEGVLIDCVKLAEDGRFRENEIRALLSGARYPARQPDKNIADLKAQVAANARGADEIAKMIAHFGSDVVNAYMGHVQDNAEESVRALIARLDDGEATVATDTGAEVRVKITIDRESRSAVIDFSGTSQAREDNFNAPEPVTRAAVLYVFRVMTGEPIPLNAGCLRPLEIRVPEGSFLKPEYPAAVVAGNVETSQVVTNALFMALKGLGTSQGTMNNLTFGDDTRQYYETICSGSPAGPDFDGVAGVQVHMTNTRLTDPEVLELRYPVVLDEFSIVRGSGGRGRQCAGDGTRRALRFLEPMHAAILSGYRELAPPGLEGGEDGNCGCNFVERGNGCGEKLSGCEETELAAGDRIIVETPTGGGFGRAKND